MTAIGEQTKRNLDAVVLINLKNQYDSPRKTVSMTSDGHREDAKTFGMKRALPVKGAQGNNAKLACRAALP